MCAQLTQRGKRRIDTDEKILQAAMHQFGEKGFTSASLTDIAAEAGVSQGLVSQRFESKENLLEAAFKATPAASFFLSASAGKAADTANDSASGQSAALLSIVTALKKEQRTDRRRFAFTAMLYTARDVPESFIALSHKLYQGTVLPALFKKAPGDGSLFSPSKEDTYHLFLVFYRNALAVIRDCAETGIPQPGDSYFLRVLGLTAEPGDGSPVTTPVTTTPPAPGDGSPDTSAITAFKEQVRPALRAVEGYIGLIQKHAGEAGRVRDYASKAELIASELVKNLDKLN